MRKFLMLGLFVLLVLALPDAQTGFPKTILQRSQMVPVVTSQQAPYMSIIPLDVSSTNWGRPDSFVVSAVYFDRFTTIKFKPMNGDTLSMPFDSLTGVPFAIDTVYHTGTTSGSQTHHIYVIGFYRYAVKDTSRKY